MFTIASRRLAFRIGTWSLVAFLALARASAQVDPGNSAPPVPSPGATTDANGIFVAECLVSFISQPILAFEEPGVVTRVPREGDQIQAQDVIATLDDEEIELRIEVADYTYRAAKLESENLSSVKYAETKAKTSLADYLAGEESNNKVNGVVTEMEMRRRKLEYETDKLSIDNAKHQLAVAKLTATAKEKELRAAEALRKRAQLRSPITGIVTEKKSDVGEYVRAGDPVARVGQLDRLRVEGRVLLADLPPKMAYNREVVVRVAVASNPGTGNEVYETFRGRIEHVSATVDSQSKYRVWTEIENRDNFVVRPGLRAEMTILK